MPKSVWLYGAVAVTFLAVTLRFLWYLRWVRRLPLDEGNVKASYPPVRVSVVLAARDEDERIEETVRRILAQEGVDLEVIVANDRSRDRTGAILDGIARGDARLKTLHITTLPKGWLGKCHACHCAAALATGEWILFTDADCWLHPRAIRRALAVARAGQADHITLAPGMEPRTLAGAGWHLAFVLCTADWLARVNRDAPDGHVGSGAFNFLRAEAYRTCGGYEALRLTVMDDVKLGLLVHQAGFRTRAYVGGSDAECHWGVTLANAIQVMEKNFYAATDYRPALSLGAVAFLWGLWGVAFFGLITGSVAGFTVFGAMLTLLAPAAVACQRLGWPLRRAALTPFIFPVVAYVLLRSMILTHWRGGVRWRDTFYPLAELRAGNVQTAARSKNVSV